MWFYEVAIDSPQNRGELICTLDMPTFIEKNRHKTLYRSVYLFPETAYAQILENKTTKLFAGEKWIHYIPIDIDRGGDSDEGCRARAIDVVNKLEYKYGLSDLNYAIYYSGTGYHIDISNEAFGFDPSPNLPLMVRETMKSMFSDIDASIYQRVGLIRVNYSLNQKSHRYKIPLEREQLELLSAIDIMALASLEPNISCLDSYEDFMGDLRGNAQLRTKIIRNAPDSAVYNKIVEPYSIATCVHELYSKGPQRGTRNIATLRIASHFRRNGIPSAATKAALLHWNNGSLHEETIVENVESVYNRNYKYGCEDALLKKHCNTRCIYFKNKDYNVMLYNAGDMFNELNKSIEKRKNNKCLDIAAMLGQDDIDCAAYAGELVTVYGPTGSGKTAFVQHLVLGMNMVTGEIEKSRQLNTIYLSLELGVGLMAQRFSQIAGGYSKAYVRNNPKEVKDKVFNNLTHIQLRLASGNIKEIEEIIRQLTPEVLVVDYLDLVDSQERGEYEKLKQIAHGLSALAVNYDIIVVAVAQVRRENAREHSLDLYAGKGSGAIENASRKVIGINGQAHSPKKHIQVFKNTDGELLEADVYHDGATMRFSVINDYRNSVFEREEG